MTDTAWRDGEYIGWMQAQWRDCADKRRQLGIFRDMTGASSAEILEALGEDPEAWADLKRHYRPYTAAEDEIIIEMYGRGASGVEISEALGRKSGGLTYRIKKLRKEGRLEGRKTEAGAPADEPEAAADAGLCEPVPVAAGGIDEICAARGKVERLLARERELMRALDEVRGEIIECRTGLMEMIGMIDHAGGEEDRG